MEVVEGDMKSLKIKTKNTLVCSKWRRLNGTVVDSGDSGSNVSGLAHRGCCGRQW